MDKEVKRDLWSSGAQMDTRSCSVLVDFLRYVEDLGLRTYDGLVIQNASDISRESDRVRVQKNKLLLQERRRQDQIHRMGFMTMPFPQDRAPPLGFSVRSQSLHSVQDETDQNHWDPDDPTNQSHWDADDTNNQSPRKRPPPKPRRDPATKLSSSEAEALTEGLIGDKLPPPKPLRNPCTQLSSSLDKSLSRNHSDRSSSDHSDAVSEEEPVYIEMGPKQNMEQDEGVYEEMIFASESKPRTVPTPFPNLLSHKAPLLTLPQNPQIQNPQTQSLDQTSPQTSDESPLTPLETTLGHFFHQDSRPKPQRNPGCKADARVRRTSDPVQDQDRGLFKPDRRSEWSQSVDQIHPERGLHRDPRTRADFRDRRLDSEPDLRPDQRQYFSLRRDPTGRDHREKRDLRDPRKGIRVEQRRERSLESLERVLDPESERDMDFTVTSSGRTSAPPLTSRSGPSPIPQSYRRSHSACPSPVKRPPPYDTIMMSAVMPHGGHVTHRLRGPESVSTLRPGQSHSQIQSQSQVHCQVQTQLQTQVQTQLQSHDQSVRAQASWFYGGLPVCGAPGFGAPGFGDRDLLMRDTMERKRVLCREIRSRTVRRPPPYGAPTAHGGARGWDSEI
ncbi:uncharacterized protein [Eucyclogobius newberryi]|uniref:uncharacterized protein n=1 Tax=Eucyclogobius newberryi TaxID=166745 RepID=UPI003B5CAFEE